MSDLNQTVDEPGRDAGSPVPALPTPTHIGRYRVERMLGRGGFGLVYLAHDEQLQRLVAVKVPHPEQAARPEDADAYLSEARTVANLDHPHIVPVYDVGSTETFPCFIVSKYIDGTDLATRLKRSRPSLREAVELVATVADALHHAHKQGLVHRDVKPANILLDRSGQPFVADFGLALREQDAGRGRRYAGTPAYMSPEQARGEGHRVDGRSDVFSLGVVFYELLTGRRPFLASTREELLEQIGSVEARPPRQIDDAVPKELDRICLKALSKRASERYSAARDMADDLRHFLSGASAEEKSTLTGRGRHGADAAAPAPSPSTPPGGDGQPVKIVPRGLRSFDAADADFFLELLPGARDRDGLPDGVRFWKARIEATDADDTFCVGLIYGPSGCGKSSLVKAGLLPRLAKSVRVVYVEATGEETEARLLKGLRRQLPDLPGDLSLGESLAALRRGRYLEPGRKVLLALDQFEQWLHARRGEENAELVRALRQCDGGRVQAVVMVRDDFWLAVSRFLQALEIRAVEGENSRLVDLFDLRHARKVLTALGRAFGALPERDLSREQDAFLDQAVAGLAQDGTVIPVRLALFAEMVKGKPWTPTTFKEVGGPEGVGVTFLDETFAASTAPARHRLHQGAAQAVLKALLPESGTDIRGHMRSRQELLEASGYASRPRDFDDLLRILDGEVRLITPTDPEGKEEADTSTLSAGAKYYQLTHDYLVPSLRDWLTRKQKETRRGRAELLLADRAAVWNARPENRQLPSPLQWLQVRWWTRKKNWTPPQKKMMARAGRHHALRGLAVVAALVLLTVAGWEVHGRLRSQALLGNLLRAPTEDVPAVVEDMAGYRRWLDEPLRRAYAEAEADHDARTQLRASLALLPVEAGQVKYLQGRLLGAEPQEAVVLREALRPHAGTLSEPLWAVLEDAKAEPGRRLRAACALAAYAPDDGRWERVNEDVITTLLAEPAPATGKWTEMLKPVGRRLLPPLAVLLLEEGLTGEARRSITGIFVAFSEGEPGPLVPLEQVLSQQVDAHAGDEERLKFLRRQANAAVVLAAAGRWEKVWPLLRNSPDPTLRSYVIDRLGPGGADSRVVFNRLEPGREPDVSARRGLLMALGEFGPDRLLPSERKGMLPRLLELYGEDPDPGIHEAVGWLLRQWQQQAKVAEIDQAHRGRQPPEGQRWYVNRQGQTMIVVPPGECEVGVGFKWFARTKGDDTVWAEGKRQKVKVQRRFALAARDVTVAEFRRFHKDHPIDKESTPTEDWPVGDVSWYDAAAYCNWLSKEEGIAEDQWCYLPNERGEYAEGMRVKANFLGLLGYRLPTDLEWEHACRAGSATIWPHGDAEELLDKYAWNDPDKSKHSRPGGGLLRPNDWGFYDLHGNLWDWCQNRYEEFPEIKDTQREDIVDSNPNQSEITGKRSVRGGNYYQGPYTVRPATRLPSVPATGGAGFRPARTHP